MDAMYLDETLEGTSLTRDYKLKMSSYVEFICSNHKRLGFRKYAYHYNKNEFRRDFKLNECDDCSE